MKKGEKRRKEEQEKMKNKEKVEETPVLK